MKDCRIQLAIPDILYGWAYTHIRSTRTILQNANILNNMVGSLFFAKSRLPRVEFDWVHVEVQVKLRFILKQRKHALLNENDPDKMQWNIL